ncbi:hypothetical protein K438DRAFT_1974976 [Mycena galopus ATCC 62051]|nr:hypothetical protein K438DRAFT_1974976 [Mycena galopus ATCC 62051]
MEQGNPGPSRGDNTGSREGTPEYVGRRADVRQGKRRAAKAGLESEDEGREKHMREDGGDEDDAAEVARKKDLARLSKRDSEIALEVARNEEREREEMLRREIERDATRKKLADQRKARADRDAAKKTQKPDTPTNTAAGPSGTIHAVRDQDGLRQQAEMYKREYERLIEAAEQARRHMALLMRQAGLVDNDEDMPTPTSVGGPFAKHVSCPPDRLQPLRPASPAAPRTPRTVKPSCLSTGCAPPNPPLACNPAPPPARLVRAADMQRPGTRSARVVRPMHHGSVTRHPCIAAETAVYAQFRLQPASPARHTHPTRTCPSGQGHVRHSRSAAEHAVDAQSQLAALAPPTCARKPPVVHGAPVLPPNLPLTRNPAPRSPGSRRRRAQGSSTLSAGSTTHAPCARDHGVHGAPVPLPNPPFTRHPASSPAAAASPSSPRRDMSPVPSGYVPALAWSFPCQ